MKTTLLVGLAALLLGCAVDVSVDAGSAAGSGGSGAVNATSEVSSVVSASGTGGAGGAPACIPLTCDDETECGAFNNGCGGVVTCGPVGRVAHCDNGSTDGGCNCPTQEAPFAFACAKSLKVWCCTEGTTPCAQ